MLKRTIGILIIATVLILVACQKDDKEQNGAGDEPNTNEKESVNQSDRAGNQKETEYDNEKNDSSNTDRDEEGKSTEDSDESEENNEKQEVGTVNEKVYDNKQEAINAIDDYEEIDQTNTDLGHGIQALIEGAAGHQYIAWNEGRWMIVIDFPNDPEYAIDEYEDGKELAKAVVNYLEENRLPAPEERGVIKIRGFSDNPETSIRWQQDNKVYQMKEEAIDPIEVLQKAVDNEANN